MNRDKYRNKAKALGKNSFILYHGCMISLLSCLTGLGAELSTTYLADKTISIIGGISEHWQMLMLLIFFSFVLAAFLWGELNKRNIE